MKDLYEILGLDQNASEDEIKRAYKRLALKYHPDRQGSKSESEKKEAEEKFKEISAAYAILSDPDKKNQYDTYGTIDENMMDETFDFGDVFGHMGGWFNSFFKNKQPTQQKGVSVQMRVGITIEDLLNGKIDRDIKYDIKARCPNCHGTGGEGVTTCPHCHGTGEIIETRRFGNSIMQNRHPCQYCNGSGTIIKNKCTNCNGTGFVTKENSVHISVNYPIQGQKINFPNKGYEAQDPKLPNGDLIIELTYSYDKSKYQIGVDEYGHLTIYEKVDIPYYDCILGTSRFTKNGSFKHKLVNGKEVNISIPKYTQEGQLIEIGKINNIKYQIVVHVKIPTYIRDSEKELLEQIKKENI